MPPRTTRKTAIQSQQLSSPPPTPTPAAASKRKNRKTKASPVVQDKAESEPPWTPVTKARKRSRGPEDHVLDELPHNLGSLPTPGVDDPPAKKKRASRAKRVVEPDPEELEKDEEDSPKAAKKTKKRASRSKKVVDHDPEELEETGQDSPKPAKKPAKPAKEKNYKLTPGQTPYPDYPHPTPEECHEVVRLLEKIHGKVVAPKELEPSLTVAGCGEVPSVLDALIRTLLSAATTGANSSRAFQSLVKTFGTIDEGVGKGSVDWNAVRLASQPEVFKAIECGGLANAKSKNIKAILQSVYEENQARSAELKAASTDNEGPTGVKNEPESEKNDEIARAGNAVLSLDHVHLLSSDEALNKLTKYPGIGPKTASCVLLFCLRRPSFAVDTHVFRLCQYLSWVPSDGDRQDAEPRVSRNSAYSHCDVRIPDELKYPLHQLFIKHGKVCPRCRAATGMSSDKWEEGCPIEHLVKRYGAKKGGAAEKKTAKKAVKESSKRTTTKKATKKSKAIEIEDDEDEVSELSEMESDFEDE